jgi:hypothetical protein
MVLPNYKMTKSTLLILLATSLLFSCQKHCYLFTSFREPATDGLHLAYSVDGYHWDSIGGSYLIPEVGGKLMRDPSIARGKDGTFHLVWTTNWKGDKGFGYASSKDLVHWSKQQFIPVMEHEPEVVISSSSLSGLLQSLLNTRRAKRMSATITGCITSQRRISRHSPRRRFFWTPVSA